MARRYIKLAKEVPTKTITSRKVTRMFFNDRITPKEIPDAELFEYAQQFVSKLLKLYSAILGLLN